MLRGIAGGSRLTEHDVWSKVADGNAAARAACLKYFFRAGRQGGILPTEGFATTKAGKEHPCHPFCETRSAARVGIAITSVFSRTTCYRAGSTRTSAPRLRKKLPRDQMRRQKVSSFLPRGLWPSRPVFTIFPSRSDISRFKVPSDGDRLRERELTERQGA
jgi:hypothetical protein